MKLTKKQKSRIFHFGIILCFYVLYLLTSFKTEEQSKNYLLLLPIPIFFIGWGLSLLISGKTMRDISKHLTDEEYAESTKLAQSYGGKVGLFFAAPFAVISGRLHTSYGINNALPYIGVFCILMIIFSPVMISHRKKMMAFMLSTEYAKEQGYNKESANQKVDHIPKEENTSL